MRRVVCWVSGMHFSDASRLGTYTKEELTVDVAVEMPSRHVPIQGEGCHFEVSRCKKS